MSAVLLDRIQFAVTTLYHFLFVPLTIGIVFLIAIMETAYVWKKDDIYRHMAQFWMKLFLINFAVGVVTGIMQEFQFGMNWSNYARFVGAVFGAPLAIEALAAFFLESTFLGLWMFGWDKVSKRVHLLSIWLVALGTTLSAFWILAANSFMQEPVGYAIHNGRAEMTNFFALISSRQLWLEFPHVWFGALATGSFFVCGISAYYLLRHKSSPVFKRSFHIAITVAAAASLLVAIVGHEQAQFEVTAQPMKMAASEALWNTSSDHAPWSLVSGIDTSNKSNSWSIQIPDALSILAYNHTSGSVEGMNQIQAQYAQKYGPGNYIPPVRITFWSFRIMVLAGGVMILMALWGLYLAMKDKLSKARRYLKVMPFIMFLPFIANLTGWIMTEVGRQPWVVFGLEKTAVANSPTVHSGMVWTTLIGFAVIYGVLAVVMIYLMLRVIRSGPSSFTPAESDEALTISTL